MERKIDALEGDDDWNDLEIVIRDTTVGTDWSPAAGEDDYGYDDLEPGETITSARRYYYDEDGEWVCEEIDPDSIDGDCE